MNQAAADSVPQPPKNTFGMPKEVYEMYCDLEEKWSVENLTQRFKQRIEDHLRVNTNTRDGMLKQVDLISAEYSKMNI